MIDNRKKARELCLCLDPHTTSVNNVDRIEKALNSVVVDDIMPDVFLFFILEFSIIGVIATVKFIYDCIQHVHIIWQ